jgi:hypothetical protein
MYARLRALRARHQILERNIQEELARPHPDDLRLKLLKQMKLKLRDEIKVVEKLMIYGGAAPRARDSDMGFPNEAVSLD